MKARAYLAMCGMAMLTACTHLTAADKSPRTSVVERLTPAGPAPWREDLGDPVLHDLLARADAGSLDVKTALARLAQARAEALGARASQSVQVQIGAAAATGAHKTDSAAKSAAAPTLDASYELDLWGKAAQGRAAADAEVAGSRFDEAQARLLVGRETAETYVGLRLAQDAQVQGVERLNLAHRASDLIATRASSGAAGSEEVATAQENLRQAQNGVEAARDDVASAQARLAALIGQTEPLALAPGPMPSPTADVTSSASSALVDRRPDVQAALARLRAADARRAEAVASTRPTFIINAALGSPDAAIVNLLDQRSLAWALAATISHALLDGRAGRARIDAATAEADAADLAYRKTVLQGWSEIRGALIAQAAARRELDAARSALGEATQAVAVAERRHRSGTVDGLAMVGVRDRAITAADRQAEALAHTAQARLQLALATGG